MSFKDQVREILDDYSDKYSTGLQLSNIVKLDKATDQAIASIVELVSKDKVKLIEELETKVWAMPRGRVVLDADELRAVKTRLTQENDK